MYQIYKVFKTSIMPEEIFELLRSSGCFVEDGFGRYQVGYFIHEYDGDSDPETNYGKQFRDNAEKMDKWFLDGGAKPDEVVLIEHG